MSFIVVKYGYKHKMIFGTNCAFAPLIDAMRENVCKSMSDILKAKEAEFKKKQKEINTTIANDKQALDKLVQANEPPKEEGNEEIESPGKEEKDQTSNEDAKKKEEKGKKETKKDAKKEEKKEGKKEEKKEAKKEEVKKEAKKEAKKDAKKEAKGKGKDQKKGGKAEDKNEEGKAEPEQEEDYETKKERLEKKIEESKADLEICAQKIKMIKDVAKRYENQADYPSVIDLIDSNEERKYIKTKKDIYANTYLTDKAGYDIVEVIIPAEGKPLIQA